MKEVKIMYIDIYTGMDMETVSYYRLSKEDGDDVVSSSIVNQRSIVQEYAKTHGIQIDREYIDDGYS